MSLPRLALAVIGDESGPSLEEMNSFCAQHDVRRLDMRTVGGRNLLGMSVAEVTAIAKTLEDAGIAAHSPHVDAIHLKDRDFAANRTVALGEGDTAWAATLKHLLCEATVPEVLASIDTHCPQDGRNTFARSVAALRRIAGEIGVDVA